MGAEINGPESIPNPERIPRLMDAMLEAEEDKTELDKIFEMVLDPRNIQHLTELSKNEILAFSVLGPLARKHDFELLKAFLAENYLNRVSKSRAGKKELVKILSRGLSHDDELNSARARFGGLTSRRGSR